LSLPTQSSVGTDNSWPGKWDYSDRREKQPGRPRIRQIIVDLILRFAKENTTWGYDRIQSALANVGYCISDTTVKNVLKAHGNEPASERQHTGSWATFLKTHWDVLAAIDFTTIEVWTRSGLVTYYLLFVMELKTRRVHFAGCTPNPNAAWMKQIARNLTDTKEPVASKIGTYLPTLPKRFNLTSTATPHRNYCSACERLP
jgi:hypothetical protein